MVILQWCSRHLLLIWAIVFLGVSLVMYQDPKGFEQLPLAALYLYAATAALFFFVYDAVVVIGFARDVPSTDLVFQLSVFVILLLADVALVARRRSAARKGVEPDVRSGPFLVRSARWAGRHIILVWGLLVFASGLAAIHFDLQYDGGGLETLAFFFFHTLGQPAFLMKWLLNVLGFDTSQRASLDAALTLGLVLCVAADYGVQMLLRRGEAIPRREQ